MQKTPEQIATEKLHHRLQKRFHKACAEYGLIADGDHILIGLSGGKDSLTLVELLGQRARIHVPSFRVTAVHVRVRERDYQSDTDYLQQFCDAFGVPLLIRDTEIGEVDPAVTRGTKAKDPCFLCAWYRRKVLFDVAQELGCNKIALGHHKDDIVETLLMNMIFQGTIATIAPMLQMDKMPIRMIRPLCLIDEADIARYAQLRQYAKQPKLCPFEHETSRAQVKQLLRQMEQLNPDVRDSIFGAMENVKPEYLPRRL